MTKKATKKPAAKSAAGKEVSPTKSGSKRRETTKTKTESKSTAKKSKEKEMPKIFPFWARFRVNKNRTTLVIDEELVKEKKTGKQVEGFVHREATHTRKKDYEEISPNPDKSDPKPMYLKRPTKRPKSEFEPHNKKLDMPQHLKERYEKNNKKRVDFPSFRLAL